MTDPLPRRLLAAIVAAVIALAAAGTQADGPALATYQGADRLQRLAEAAKREGELTIYTSTPVEDMFGFACAAVRSVQVGIRNWRRGYSLLERPDRGDEIAA